MNCEKKTNKGAPIEICSHQFTPSNVKRTMKEKMETKYTIRGIEISLFNTSIPKNHEVNQIKKHKSTHDYYQT